MNLIRISLTCAAALALASPVLADDAMNSMKDKTFNFGAQNGSGETGTVTLKRAGDASTMVTIALKGAPTDAQPAHIHAGTCAKLDPKPAYPLSNVVNGASTTTVSVPMAKLIGGGFAVNVHRSTSDIATYVSCADLGGMGMMKDNGMAPESKPSP